MAGSIRSGLRAGAIVGAVIVFLVLIGFDVIASELIHGLLDGQTQSGTGSVQGLLVFFGLLGVWAGAFGARRTVPDTWTRAIVAGLSAGVLSGLMLLAMSLILGTIRADGADLRLYLAQLSPEAVDLLLLQRAPVPGAFANFGLLVVAGAVGGLAARGVGRGAWRGGAAAAWRARRQAVAEIPLLMRARAHPLARPAFSWAALGVLLLMPLALGQYWNFTLGTVGIYVLMGLGLNIVVGLAGLLDLGYVAFFAVGAYTVGLLTSPPPDGVARSFWLFLPPDSIWRNFWVVLPLAVLVAALAGIVLGIPVLRLRGDYLAIVTLGFGEIIRILVKSDVLSRFTGGPQGVRAIGGPTLFGQPFSSERDFMYLIILGILLVILVTRRLQDSRVGRAWIAMREDETVAQSMGVNVYRAKLLAFATGAAFAGLGGVLFASRNQYTGPEDHSLMVSINVLCLVIVGGMGSVPGVVVGALALKGLPEILRQIDDYRILAFGALLVAMMAWRPEGLWPSQRRRLEMRRREGELDEPLEPPVVVEGAP